jgi:hypothetical protein
MKHLTPRHVQEAESDRRSIKVGWYATNLTGQVCSGRFSNQEDCQAHIAQERTHIGSWPASGTAAPRIHPSSHVQCTGDWLPENLRRTASEQFYTDTLPRSA